MIEQNNPLLSRHGTEIDAARTVISSEVIAYYERRARDERAAALKALSESATQWLSRSRQRVIMALTPNRLRQVNA